MEIELNFEEELQKLDLKIKDAKENFGDTEVRDAYIDKALFYKKYQKFEQAIETFDLSYQKAVGASKKMEIVFEMLLIRLDQKNLEQIKKYIDLCKKLLEEGGDWEKKNKLKVYEGLYMILIRKFKEAANFFIDSVSTFNSPEIIPYNQIIEYTVLLSMVSLSRSEIKKKKYYQEHLLQILIIQ